jgi:hypothetical protein
MGSWLSAIPFRNGAIRVFWSYFHTAMVLAKHPLEPALP